MKNFILPFMGGALGLFLILLGAANVHVTPSQKLFITAPNISLQDTLVKYTTKGYRINHCINIGADVKDLYDASHFPTGKLSINPNYLIVFDK